MSAVMTSRSMPSLGTKYSFVRLPRALSLSRSLPAMVERGRVGSRELGEGREVFTSRRKSCTVWATFQPRGRQTRRGKKQRVGEAGKCSAGGRKMMEREDHERRDEKDKRRQLGCRTSVSAPLGLVTRRFERDHRRRCPAAFTWSVLCRWRYRNKLWGHRGTLAWRGRMCPGQRRSVGTVFTSDSWDSLRAAAGRKGRKGTGLVRTLLHHFLQELAPETVSACTYYYADRCQQRQKQSSR
jgi:hypothetical protein